MKSTRQPPATVSRLWADYLEYLGDRPSAKTLGYTGTRVLRHFGSMCPDQIEMQHCRSYTERRYKDGVSPGTVHTELGHLRMALNWGVKTRAIPFAPHIERPSKPQPKARFLTRDEIRRLLAVEMAPHVRLTIILLLQTAARVGAVLDLTWDRVDLERRVIDLRLDTSAPRKGRAVVPISDTLVRTLAHHRGLRHGAVPYVVTWNGQRVLNVRNGLLGACKRAGLRDVSPHVFRHTAAVHLAEGGLPMEELSQFLGHSDINVTRKVYARFSPSHLRAAADILDFQ